MGILLKLMESIGIGVLSNGFLKLVEQYCSTDIKYWPEGRIKNLVKILDNAISKTKGQLNPNGKLSPRIVKIILDDATWCNDEIQLEYFGGVLAASNTLVDRDDRGHYYASIVKNLSTYQLRTHFLFYHLLRKHYLNNRKNFNDGRIIKKMKIYLPMSTYNNYFKFSKEEYKDEKNILAHALYGLADNNLIGHVLWGHNCKSVFDNAENDGIIFSPSRLGAELFMWAQGHGNVSIDEFFQENLKFRDCNLQIGKSFSVENN